jgi:RNA polymerase sigma factor (sigma-70 family)
MINTKSKLKYVRQSPTKQLKKIKLDNKDYNVSFEDLYYYFIKLIKTKAYYFNYEPDELIQEGLICLWKCYLKYSYDSKYNEFIAYFKIALKNSFISYFKIALKNSFISYYNKNERINKKYKKKDVLVLNTCISDSDVELINYLEATENQYSIESKEIFLKIISKLSTQDKFIIKAYISGYSQTEIARELNVSISYINLAINTILSRLRRLYLKEIQ